MTRTRQIMVFVIIGVAQARASCWAMTPQIQTDMQVYVIASKACDQQQAGESSVTQPPQFMPLARARNPAISVAWPCSITVYTSL